MRPQIPVAPPPGIDAGMYQQALAYLKANPEVAMQTQEQVMSLPCQSTASRRLLPAEYRPYQVALIMTATLETLGCPCVQVRRMGNPMMAQAASAHLQDPEYRCRPLGSLALCMQADPLSAQRSMNGSGESCQDVLLARPLDGSVHTTANQVVPVTAARSDAVLRCAGCRKKMEVLREDPDLKPIFHDIASSGTAGMERHWNDVELMSKISRKMGEMGIAPQPAPQPPGKTLPVRFCAVVRVWSAPCNVRGGSRASPSLQLPGRTCRRAVLALPTCQSHVAFAGDSLSSDIGLQSPQCLLYNAPQHRLPITHRMRLPNTAFTQDPKPGFELRALLNLQVRPTNLHDAAKAGDTDATASLLEVRSPPAAHRCAIPLSCSAAVCM